MPADLGALRWHQAGEMTGFFRVPGWHQVCQQEGFTENAAKRRILRRSNQQRITGIVVNAGLAIPRAARREFRATLHNCRQHGVAAQARGRKDFAAYLLGFASYVKMVQPTLGNKLLQEVRAVLREDKAKRLAGGQSPG